MKKRVLSLALVLALMLCLVPAEDVSAAADMPAQTWSHLTVSADGKTATGYCPHCCDSTSETVTWKLYTRTNGHNLLATSGHYFLGTDSNMTGALRPNVEGLDFVLHLNGKRFTRSGTGNTTGAIYVNAANTTFSIVDDQAGKGALVGTVGSAVNVNGKAGTKIVLYSGNLTSTVTTVANISGGAVSISAGTFDMYGGTINGSVATYGGALAISGATTVNIYGGTIQGGTATDRGGNIYMASTTSALNIYGGTIQNGTCLEKGIGGGNVYVNNGTFTLSGGTIQGGKAPKGGNIYSNTATSINGTASLKNGEAAYGGNLYVNKALTLGAVSFVPGSATYGSDIYVAAKANMTVDKTYNGSALIYYAMCHVPNAVLGGYLTHQTNVTFGSGDPINRCTGAFTGKLYLENTPGRPLIYAKGTSKYLHIANTDSTALVDRNGNTTWYDSQDAAIAAYSTNTAYMIAGRQSMPLTGGDYVVDLAGHNVTITGTGSVTLFDSANADYATYGTAYVNGPALKNTFKTTVEGNDYYMVQTDTYKYTFHRIGLEIISVSVRPSNAGMYYTGAWQCDDVLANKVERFGVAASVVNMPKDDFATNKDTKYTTYTDFSKRTATGVTFTNIVKENNEQNTARSMQKVYAAAYVVFEGEVVAIGSEPVAYSLYDALEIAEDQLYSLYYNNSESTFNGLSDFYNKWTESGVRWDMDLTLNADEKAILDAYKGKNAYHGEAHEHADTSGYSDGSHTLNQWKKSLVLEGLDFTTIVDHRQVSHMTNSNWDTSLFIGGTEASTSVDKNAGNKMHYSVIFTDAAAAKTIAEKYCYSKVLGVPAYKDLTTTQIKSMIAEVQAAGGMFTIVHPKSSGYFGTATQPEDYYFADWTGLEVFYGAGGYAPTQDVNVQNYQLWLDLLALGKKVWATAGSDQHAGASTNALTTIYSDIASATKIFDYMKTGNSTCGPVGIRMIVGNTQMGGQSQEGFAGQRVIFTVDDFHEGIYDPSHTYSVKLIKLTKGATAEEVVHSQVFDAAADYFFATDADDTAAYYRVEVWDDTAGYKLPIAIGNPIWNK